MVAKWCLGFSCHVCYQLRVFCFISAIIGGSVIVETVFGWPGLGQLAYESLFARDLNLLLGIFLLSAVIVLVVNLLVDILYTFLDPRIEL